MERSQKKNLSDYKMQLPLQKETDTLSVIINCNYSYQSTISKTVVRFKDKGFNSLHRVSQHGLVPLRRNDMPSAENNVQIW
uniref:Uncharacterized protein n=1 Tax=Arion vulgaris TaxID=1028688 RepID=A0A0B6ZX34_9EUPU